VDARGDDTGFYDASYGRFTDALYAAIRLEAFGEDIGQNSWLTADEQRRFCEWLALDRSSELLEVASGSGGPALFTAASTGCRVTGVDVHEAGVNAANAAAGARGLADRARFLCADARGRLPFEDGSFDAVLCIDSINHLYERAAVLREWHRLLRADGRVLFTDPITVTGMLRREEMLLRSGAMGEFVFTPPGLDQRLLREAGFADIRVEDLSEGPALVACAWLAARERRAAELDRVEGTEQNAATQRLLATVAALARDRRLSRFAYLARRPAGAGE
jgi:SAM-dependent methyltransferase